jgi:DNA-binding transcriptional MerR regulator
MIEPEVRVAASSGEGKAARDRRDASQRAGEQGLLFGGAVSPLPDDVGYRGPTACAAAGITYRQLDYWARTDLVRPSVCDANGSGTQRLYSYRDLVELKVIKRLLDADISLQAARKAIEYLREQLGADLASAHLVLDGGHTVLVQTGDQIVDLLRNGQGVLNIVSLGPVVSDLASELHDVGADELVPIDDATVPHIAAR